MKRVFVGVLMVVMLCCGSFAGVVKAASFGDYTTKSKSFILYNLRDKEVLAEEKADDKLPVASLTKIMTALVVLTDTELELGQTIEITAPMLNDLAAWAKVDFKAGQKATVEDLLYALMLPSAGDAGQALAVAGAGSIENFAKKMNEKAEALGLTNTHFTNPIGRDTDNYSTARDTATLLMEALKNEEFKKIFEANSYDLKPLNKTIKKTVNLENNALVGAKTGFTYEAGRCLASTARLAGADYLLVVLGADWRTTNHIGDTRAIYDYYGEHYAVREILAPGEEVWRVPVADSEQEEYVLASEGWEKFLANEDDLVDAVWELEVLEEVNRTVEPGDRVATLRVRRGEEVIFEEDYLMGEEIEYRNHVPLVVGIGVVFGVLVIVMVILKKKLPKLVVIGVIMVGAGVAVAAGLTLLIAWAPEMKTVEIERGPVAYNGEKAATGEVAQVSDERVEVSTTTTATKKAAAAASGGGNCTLGWGKLMLINPKWKVSTSWISARKGQLINITNKYGIREGNSANGAPLMDAEAASHLAQMLAAYTAAYPGHSMETRSCFRSKGTSCGRLCYATGTSDHHSGYTCDLLDPSYGTRLNTDFYSSHPDWQWLKANSYKYGFIDRFPQEWAGGPMSQPVNITEAGSTGLFETWHYRYVGVEAATEIATGKYNGGKYDSLEHYLKASGRISSLLGLKCN